MFWGIITLVFHVQLVVFVQSVCLKGDLSSQLLPLEHDAPADIYIYDVMMRLPLEQDAAILDKGAMYHLKENKLYTCTSVWCCL